MSLNEKVVLNLFKEEEFLNKYKEYVSSKLQDNNMIRFLNGLEINKSYYKLNIIQNISELKIKTINGYLNKLTTQNYDEIVKNILEEIKKDSELIDITISCLFEKCILQKSYMSCYIQILQTLDELYKIQEKIQKQVTIYTQLFQKMQDETVEEKYKQQYVFLCETNKLTDNYICFCETIYHLEEKKLIQNMYDQMIQTFLNKMDSCLQEDPPNTKDIYKYLSCMENIYLQKECCPLEIKQHLKKIQSKIKDKKIIFKIMDIVELNEPVL